MRAKLRLFDTATAKLTLLYTAVLMVLSLFFSGVIGFTTSRIVTRPSRNGDIVVSRSFRDGDIERFLVEQRREVNEKIIAALVFVNLAVLVFGGAFSFLLARWTLKPIERAMDDEARFVADASHELRTPLAVMQTENEVTLRDKSPSVKKLRAQVQSIMEEVGKLRRLTDYLLQMNAEGDIEMKQADLTAVIATAEKRVEQAAKARGVTIARHVQPSIITTNQEALSEIVAIILDNAIKYSPKKSEIVVTANAGEISVSDAGDGISEDDLPHIFDRFFRAESSRTSDGFGLGLSLAKNLSEKIGVKVAADNVTKNGAVIGAKFTIKL